MRRCLIISLITLVACYPGILCGQDIPIGSWRYHLSYNQARLLTGDEELVFCAVENGLYSISDGRVQIITKNDGLSAVTPQALTYDPASGYLILGYGNSLLDFVSPEEIVTIDDLRALDFGVPKGINKIIVDSQVAYIATDFGIVSVDMDDLQIAQIFTEIGPEGTQVAIKDITTQSDSIYALADIGILIGSLQDNLLDFNNWTLIEEPLLERLQRFQDRILSYRGDELLEVNQNLSSVEPLLEAGFDIRDLGTSDGQLFILGATELAAWDGELLQDISVANLQSGNEVLVTAEAIWIADRSGGLWKKRGELEEQIVPNGPKGDEMAHIKFEDSLFAFYPLATSEDLGYSVFTNDWSNERIEGFGQVTDVASLDNRMLLSSNESGVFDLRERTTLDLGLPANTAIPALLSRNDGTWVLPVGVSDALIFLESSGGILRFDSSTVGTNQATLIQQSEAGTLWLATKNSSNGIYTYNPIEGQRRRITTADDLPSNVIRSLVLDLEDEAWIGTAGGPAFFPDGSFVFDDFGAILPIFENDILLEGENITALAIDGGNRKWIGTDNGIWVFSANTDRLDLRFIADESPLLSDEIRSFAYDPGSGEMFILTSKGLCSYQTGSSEGLTKHSNVNIYPNPVYPNDVGPVTMTGLARDAIIKVTDINGRLVTEFQALGGTATWDLRDTNGSVATGGVYLLFSSTADGEDTFVGKVAIIR